MQHQLHCQDNPKVIRFKRFCIDELSKNVKGRLEEIAQEIQPCEPQGCKTLKTRHELELSVRSHEPCDSEHGQLFNGTIVTDSLVHAFKDGSFTERAVHAAEFQWFGAGIYAVGTFSGTTNANTNREPIFDDCKLPCNARGIMEGRFCGTVIRAQLPHLVGCQILGTYRFRIETTQNVLSGPLVGTMEGVIMCDCKPGVGERICIDFTTFNPGAGPNPRNEQGVTFLVRDFQGNITPNTEIWQIGGFTGLNANYTTEISLPALASNVSVTLAHFSTPATVRAINADGSIAGSAVMSLPQGQAETIQFSGSSINRVVINAPQNEVVLLEFCYEPAN